MAGASGDDVIATAVEQGREQGREEGREEARRALVREAARRGDGAHPEALSFILACKADAAETAVRLANEAMTLCGGAAYRENSRVARLLRDARAAHVMTPTTGLLKLWTGRSLLGLPLL